MNNTTVSLKEMINYIRKKKLFLVIWILVITSLFAIYSFSIKREYKAKVNYRFPQLEISTDSMSDVLDFLQRGKTFKSNFQWLQKAIRKDSQNNQFIVKKNGNNFNISISLTRENPNNLEKDFLIFVNKIDNLFLEEKLSELLVKKNDISDQIKNLNSGENTFEKTVTTKKLNEILEKLIIEEYFIKNLTKESIEKVIIEDKTVSKNILIFGSLIFSIWSGLMIVMILYFTKRN